MTDILIDDTLFDTTDEYSPGANLVFTSTSVGYCFYVDGSSDVVFSKTTDGGATWGTAVALAPDKTWGTVGIWYDRWTPGDTTGTLIYVVALETVTDDLWFNSVDTGASDAQSGWVVAVLGSDYTPVPDGPCSVCKGANGVLYAAGVFGAANSPRIGLNMARSTDSGVNWSAAGSGFDSLTTEYVDDDDECCLVPLLTDDDILLVVYDHTATTIYWHRWDAVGLSWSAQQTLGTHVGSHPNYPVMWSMTGNPVLGDAYLANLTPAVAGTGAIEFWHYDESSGALGAWTQKEDVVQDNATPNQLVGCALTYDFDQNDIICYYGRGTPAATIDIFAKISTNDGASWGAESSKFNDGTASGAADDYKGIRCNWANSLGKYYVTWYDDDDNDLFGSDVVVYRATGVTKDSDLVADGEIPLVAVQFPNTTPPYNGAFVLATKTSKPDGTFTIVSWTTDKVVVYARDPGAPERWGSTEFLTPI